MSHFFYAGIGSRRTPVEVLRRMTRLATRLEELGGILRSGGAPGADKAFHAGTGFAEIYIPWNGFEGLQLGARGVIVPGGSRMTQALEATSLVHPNWGACSQGAQRLHTRNWFQIHGESSVDPVSLFVLCWTPDGCEDGKFTTRDTGGTGQAIRLASLAGVPVFNMNKPNTERRLRDFLVTKDILTKKQGQEPDTLQPT